MKSKIISIAGDASTRKFQRIILNKKSKVSVVAKKEKYKNLIAYTAVNKFLRKNKILAPKLFSYNYSKGVIFIEDFGDFTFYKVLKKKREKLKTYKKLVDVIIKIQKVKPKEKIQSIISKPHIVKKYSSKYLYEEANLFCKWYLPLVLSNNKSLIIEKKIKKILFKLFKRINFTNSYFVHRDYHSQNLMKVGKKVAVIDTQDAIIGNPAYDLVSLIDDVRIKTSNSLKKDIYKYYIKKTIFINNENEIFFMQDFNILSVQRSLKIIGIFSRLFKRDKKVKYLKFIPYTWKLLEMRMHSEIFYDLKKILKDNISKNTRNRFVYK